LFEGEKLVASDHHDGSTGWKHHNNTYTLELNDLRTNLDSYTLKAKVSGDGGSDSSGALKIHRE